MKNSIVITAVILATFSLTAFGCMNMDNEDGTSIKIASDESKICNKKKVITKKPDFIYDVHSRFLTRISKTKVLEAKSIIDLLPSEATEGIDAFKNVKVAIVPVNGDEIIEMGENKTLNASQLELLQSVDYTTNFCVRAEFKRENPNTGELEDNYVVYYMSIVPETEVKFVNGNSVLIDYFKKNSKKDVAKIDTAELKPGKVHFTITKEGKITNIKLASTSGFDAIDEKMISLIKAIPGEWEPALNSKGEKVDQELVYSFGIMGC
ncbi:MAG: hypothetical protein ACJAUD_002776 [Crocinitomicaceae bacterium]|jgi:hypothetical protein